MFLDHTQRRSTLGRTPLDEWSARRRDLYLTTHDTHNRQISMPPVGFEPTISAGERPQSDGADGARCPPSVRPTITHVWKTRGCQCSFRSLMMGGVSPETYSASYKYGIIKFWYIVASCWIFFMNCTMMHGSTNNKKYLSVMTDGFSWRIQATKQKPRTSGYFSLFL